MGVFILAALIGLFVFARYSGGKNPNATGIGKVEIWGTVPAVLMDPAMKAAIATDFSLKDVSYVYKSEYDLEHDLAAAIATGRSPDLVLASQEQLIELTDFIVPIPAEQLKVNDFKKKFAEEGELFIMPGNVGYYGLPFLIDPLVLFYNRSILSSAGIAEPPTTWSALTGLAPSLTVLTSSRQVTRGLIAMGTYDNVRAARGILSTLFMQASVPITYRTSGTLRADLGQSSGSGIPKGVSVLRFYTQFADPAKVTYTWNASLPDSRSFFSSGDLSLYLGYSSESRFFRQANPNLDFDVAPIPQLENSTVKATYGLAYAFMLPRGTKNRNAVTAAQLLTTVAAEKAAAAASGLAPAVRAALASTPADPVDAVAYKSALYAKGWMSPAPADTDRVFSAMINNVISGRLTVESALSGASSALTPLIQK